MANKVVVTELPPFLLASIRFCLAALIVFISCLLSGINIRIGFKELKNTFIAGFFFLSFGNGIAVWALQYIDSSLAAIIISTQPLVILLMLRIIEKKRIMMRSIIGVGFGICGILLLVSQDNLISSSKQWLGVFALFICLLSWAYGSIFVSKAQLPKNHFVSGAYQMFFGGILLLIASHLFGEPTIHILEISNRAIIALFYLIVFGSIIAFTSFNFLLVRISPEKVATSTYINPIVAIICGWYFLDEIITWRSIFATFILLIGVYFINTVRFQKETP